jgi:hypothetical protein
MQISVAIFDIPPRFMEAEAKLVEVPDLAPLKFAVHKTVDKDRKNKSTERLWRVTELVSGLYFNCGRTKQEVIADINPKIDRGAMALAFEREQPFRSAREMWREFTFREQAYYRGLFAGFMFRAVAAAETSRLALLHGCPEQEKIRDDFWKWMAFIDVNRSDKVKGDA